LYPTQGLSQLNDKYYKYFTPPVHTTLTLFLSFFALLPNLYFIPSLQLQLQEYLF